MADSLERQNQSLMSENQRLKTQFKSQENDREYLIQQLVNVKKDNARFQQEQETLKNENDELKEKINNLNIEVKNLQINSRIQNKNKKKPQGRNNRLVKSAGAPEVNLDDGTEFNKLLRLVDKYKSQLEKEKRNQRNLRSTYARELQDRTELETFLRECIKDVRREIERKRTQLSLTTAGFVNSDNTNDSN